jgi:hypothetical protein
VCSHYHISPACGGGTCNGACDPGFADCNGNKQTDGCEINVASDPNNCGTCGNVCGRGMICTNGVCTGGSPPPVTCQGMPDGAPCNDGNACTANDVCQGGTCVGGPPPNCDDGNMCTADSCSPQMGCLHTDVDGLVCCGCTCQGGTCVSN